MPRPPRRPSPAPGGKSRGWEPCLRIFPVSSNPRGRHFPPSHQLVMLPEHPGRRPRPGCARPRRSGRFTLNVIRSHACVQALSHPGRAIRPARRAPIQDIRSPEGRRCSRSGQGRGRGRVSIIVIMPTEGVGPRCRRRSGGFPELVHDRSLTSFTGCSREDKTAVRGERSASVIASAPLCFARRSHGLAGEHPQRRGKTTGRNGDPEANRDPSRLRASTVGPSRTPPATSPSQAGT